MFLFWRTVRSHRRNPAKRQQWEMFCEFWQNPKQFMERLQQKECGGDDGAVGEPRRTARVINGLGRFFLLR